MRPASLSLRVSPASLRRAPVPASLPALPPRCRRLPRRRSSPLLHHRHLHALSLFGTMWPSPGKPACAAAAYGSVDHARFLFDETVRRWILQFWLASRGITNPSDDLHVLELLTLLLLPVSISNLRGGLQQQPRSFSTPQPRPFPGSIVSLGSTQGLLMHFTVAVSSRPRGRPQKQQSPMPKCHAFVLKVITAPSACMHLAHISKPSSPALEDLLTGSLIYLQHA